MEQNPRFLAPPPGGPFPAFSFLAESGCGCKLPFCGCLPLLTTRWTEPMHKSPATFGVSQLPDLLGFPIGLRAAYTLGLLS